MSLHQLAIQRILKLVNFPQALKETCRFSLVIEQLGGCSLVAHTYCQDSANQLIHYGISLVQCALMVIPIRSLMVWGPTNQRPLIFPAEEITDYLLHNGVQAHKFQNDRHGLYHSIQKNSLKFETLCKTLELELLIVDYESHTLKSYFSTLRNLVIPRGGKVGDRLGEILPASMVNSMTGAIHRATVVGLSQHYHYENIQDDRQEKFLITVIPLRDEEELIIVVKPCPTRLQA